MSSPPPQRPQSILQRVQRASIIWLRRRSTPGQRPETAPNLSNRNAERQGVRGSNGLDDQAPLLHSRTNESDPPNEPCSNDSNTYYSFPPIERSRWEELLCDFCVKRNDRHGRRTTDNEGCSDYRPCTPRRRGRPCAHLAPDRRGATSGEDSSRVARERNAYERFESDDDLPPAIPIHVQPGDRPKRASIPPHLSPLSAGFSRGEGANRRPPTRRGPVPSSDRGSTGSTLGSLIHRLGSSASGRTHNSSPKVHHLFGSQDNPYVRKHDAQKYRDAVQTLERYGIPAESVPKIPISRPAKKRTSNRNTGGTDYSETVFYRMPGTRSSIRTVPEPVEPTNLNIRLRPVIDPETMERKAIADVPNPLPSTESKETVKAVGGRVLVDPDGHPLKVELEIHPDDVARIERKHRNPPSPTEIGGLRMELRGGRGHGSPRLRGGAWGRSSRASDYISSVGYRLKSAFLTCGSEGCGPYTNSSDEEDEPNRIVNTKALTHAGARVPLPSVYMRGGSSSSSHTHLYKTPTPSPSASTSQPSLIPCLRGGASSPDREPIPKFADSTRLPASLYWLAGGCGRPITAKAWRLQKPEKRMGGLFGAVIYGRKAGVRYTNTERGRPERVAEEKEKDDGEGGGGDGGERVSSSSRSGSTSSSTATPSPTPSPTPDPNENAAQGGGGDGGAHENADLRANTTALEANTAAISANTTAVRANRARSPVPAPVTATQNTAPSTPSSISSGTSSSGTSTPSSESPARSFRTSRTATPVPGTPVATQPATPARPSARSPTAPQSPAAEPEASASTGNATAGQNAATANGNVAPVTRATGDLGLLD